MIFIAILVVLVFFAWICALYPLRKNPRVCVLLTPVIFLAIYLAYSKWGGFSKWHKYLDTQANRVIVHKLMETPDGPIKLIEKLKVQLKKQPNSAKGWYLLGRLYASRGNWDDAQMAFAKALVLTPEDEATIVNYGQSLWQNNNQQFNFKIRKIFNDLLVKKPDQPDALAMLAIDAYAEKKYQRAINYWEKLLKFIPVESEEAIALHKAIAKARANLVHSQF